jgi:hypothetical protein
LYGKYPTKKSNLTNGLTSIHINTAEQVPNIEVIGSG